MADMEECRCDVLSPCSISTKLHNWLCEFIPPFPIRILCYMDGNLYYVGTTCKLLASAVPLVMVVTIYLLDL